MTDIFCIKEKDFMMFVRNVRNSRTVRSGEFSGIITQHFSSGINRINRLAGENACNFLARRVQEMGYILDREVINFPPRMRWGQEAGDRLIALKIIQTPLVLGTKTKEAIARWTKKHALDFNIIWTHGDYVPPSTDPSVLTLVLGGSAHGTIRYDNVLAWQQVTPYMDIFAPKIAEILPQTASMTVDSRGGLEKVANTFYFPGYPSNSCFFDYVVANLIERCVIPDYDIISNESLNRINRLKFLNFSQDWLSEDQKIIKQTEADIEELKKRKNLEMHKIVCGRQAMQHAQTMLISDIDQAIIEKKANRLFEQLKSFDKVEEMYFEGQRLVVRTKPLIAKNPAQKDKFYMMGSYIIKFPEAGSKDWVPTIQNITRRLGGIKHHPHIQGRACWGNLGESLPSLIESGEYAAALGMLIAFLETWNPNDVWGNSISQWPMVINNSQ